jgi:hypothetical protein
MHNIDNCFTKIDISVCIFKQSTAIYGKEASSRNPHTTLPFIHIFSGDYSSFKQALERAEEFNVGKRADAFYSFVRPA